jgi:hypothetical protein
VENRPFSFSRPAKTLGTYLGKTMRHLACKIKEQHVEPRKRRGPILKHRSVNYMPLYALSAALIGPPQNTLNALTRAKSRARFSVRPTYTWPKVTPAIVEGLACSPAGPGRSLLHRNGKTIRAFLTNSFAEAPAKGRCHYCLLFRKDIQGRRWI